MIKRSNAPMDVFKHINMHVLADGTPDPDKCWEHKQAETLIRTKRRPYFALQGKKVLAYRVVWELYNGRPLEQNEIIRHTCDNPVCCNPLHLQVGTHQDNMNDMKKRDRHGITAHAHRAILGLLNAGRPVHEIASLYGVSDRTIRRIRDGETKQLD